MLLFKKKFLDAIRRGEKTQTIRLWKRRRYRPGQRSFIPGVGPIVIDQVDEVAWEELTETDAILDGFPSLETLRQEIEEIYGLSPDKKMFRVRFHLQEVAPQHPPMRMHTFLADFELTLDQTAEKLLEKCRIYRSTCDWNHEPGKSHDFFALFLQSPRNAEGIPLHDGFRLESLLREQLSAEQWQEIGWLVHDVCRSWTEWQYAVEHFWKEKQE
ncbi:MAG: ASCH domain-containing protein [Planctomycetia bacterium]|nr:ASCH domain-containing protein [Planctomycetia bacterium]